MNSIGDVGDGKEQAGTRMLMRPGSTRTAAAVVTGVVVLAVVLPSAITLAKWDTVVWWGTPSRLHWCGRDYQRSSGYVQRSQIVLGRLDGSGPYPLEKVGDFPSWSEQAVIASVTPPAVRKARGIAVCAMTVYLRVSGKGYAPFTLEGGP